MGGHLDQCSACGHRTICYDSCRIPELRPEAPGLTPIVGRGLLEIPAEAPQPHAILGNPNHWKATSPRICFQEVT